MKQRIPELENPAARVTQRSLTAHPAYRPDIDGLRALAVLSVIVFHVFPQRLSGGFIGVDIFFVISGFLISSILFEDFQKNTFSFADFYTRRARRIFPALITVLFPVAAFGWYVLTPDEFAMLGKQIAAGAGFVGNIAFWLESGYFDSSANTKPLLHLWSLGVEEQFYIVWPLLLYGAWRKGASFLTVIIVLGLASFALNVAGVNRYSDAVFYLPITRFWELLAGATLAYVAVIKRVHSADGVFGRATSMTLVPDTMSVAGLGLLIGSLLLLDKSRVFPGWWAALPVLGTVMIISAGPQGVINRLVLGNRVATFIGLISYPLYLWHWPLLAFAQLFYGHVPVKVRLMLLGATLILAWLTWKLVEKRLRRKKSSGSSANNRRQVLVLYGVMVAFCAAGLLALDRKFTPRNTTPDIDALLAAQHDWEFPPRHFKKVSTFSQVLFERAGTDTHYTVFIGDSLMQHYAARIERLLSERAHPSYSVIFATGGGCPSVPNLVYVAAHQHPDCENVGKVAYETARRSDVKKVVIGGSWHRYLDDKSREFVIRSGNRQIRYGEPGALDAAFAALEEQVALLSETKQVYIVLNPPQGEKFAPQSMLDGSRWTLLRRRQAVPAADIAEFVQQTAPIRARLIAIASRHGAKIIDPVQTLCKGTICPTVSESNEPYFMDSEHMRPFYARDAATFLDETIRVQR